MTSHFLLSATTRLDEDLDVTLHTWHDISFLLRRSATTGRRSRWRRRARSRWKPGPPPPRAPRAPTPVSRTAGFFRYFLLAFLLAFFLFFFLAFFLSCFFFSRLSLRAAPRAPRAPPVSCTASSSFRSFLLSHTQAPPVSCTAFWGVRFRACLSGRRHLSLSRRGGAAGALLA